MTDQGLARRLAEFERRLRGLERGDRLTRSSVVVDDTGRSLGVTAAVVTGSREAALIAARALVTLLAPGDPAGQSVWFTDSEPVGAAVGDLWLRAGLEPTVALYAAGTWADLADQTTAPAIAGLRSGIATDDGRIVVWSLPTVPAGVPAFGDLWLQAATVAYRWEGDAGWQPLVVAEGQSLNYVDGVEGWTITPDGDSQFRDIASLGQVSGAAGSFDQLSIGGADLTTTLADKAAGKILEQRKETGTNAGSIAGTEVGLYVMNLGRLAGGRQYRLNIQFTLTITGTIALRDKFVFRLRSTTDGTEPTVSTPVMADCKSRHDVVTMGDVDAYLSTTFDLATDTDLQILLTGQRGLGGTTAAVYQGTGGLPAVFSLYDEGSIGSLSTTAVKQRLGLAEGVPISSFTKTYNAVWAWGVDAGGNLINDSWFSTGNSAFGSNSVYGLVGFDSSAIVAGLANSTTPTNATLRWRPRTRATAGGLDVRLMTHNYASRAAAAADIGYPEEYTNTTTPPTVVGSRSNAVNGTLYDNALGVTAFNQFKAGTRKGIGIGSNNAPYTSHPDGTGSVYGNGTYECQLIFTYQGTS